MRTDFGLINQGMRYIWISKKQVPNKRERRNSGLILLLSEKIEKHLLTTKCERLRICAQTAEGTQQSSVPGNFR